MKLFEHSSGTIFAFGFDMIERKPNPRRIAWSDTDGDLNGRWERLPTSNAGFNDFRFEIAPEFIFEANGKVIAYQPGLCIEMTFVGAPLIWSFNIMRPDSASLRRAA